eukprot:scaffold10970_cov83-Skeletonema_dohrnii-CCMP3373.AAC.5
MQTNPSQRDNINGHVVRTTMEGVQGVIPVSLSVLQASSRIRRYHQTVEVGITAQNNKWQG